MFKSIEDVWCAFEKQIQHLVHHAVEACNSADYAYTEGAPLPSLSGLVDDCTGKGFSLQHGGVVCNFTGPQAFGVVDCGDSIYMMQTYVLENKEFTMVQLEDALGHNFGCGCCKTAPDGEARIYEAIKRVLSSNGSIDVPVLQSQFFASQTANAGDGEYARVKRIMESITWHGNNVDDVDLLAGRCGQIYSREVEKYKNPRGEVYQVGCYPVSVNVLSGKDVGALPDGRLAEQPSVDGISPRQGKDTNGPTATAMSVVKLDHENYPNGILYNQRFLPSAPAGDKGLKRFSAVVHSYFDHKGMHAQLNVIDKNILLDAQAHPELYKDLVVCVAGYGTQFTVLAKEVQDDIISRTEQVF